MAREILMPKMGLTMTEGTIRTWHKQKGDIVEVGDALFDVETDKLTNTIEADTSGNLVEVFVSAGESVPVKTILALIATEGEDIEDYTNNSQAGESKSVQSSNEDTAYKQKNSAEISIDNYIPATPYAKKIATDHGINLADVSVDISEYIRSEQVTRFIEASLKRPKATPMAAITAKNLGVALENVPVDGRIRKEDVDRFVKREATVERETMSRMRKLIAERMLSSQQETASVNFTVSVDMSEVKQLRESLKPIKRVSFNDILLLIIARTLKDYPMLNASIDGEEIIYHNAVHMGVAVAVDDGLMVPVLRNADSRSLTDISDETAELARTCRDMSINPDLLEGSTFSLTNLGMYGMESFTPIINRPNVAILGINSIVNRPIVIDEEVVIKPMMNLSLTVDHRLIDGAVAAQFLGTLKARIEQPALLLL